ncbi:MAG TPA: PA0069 family radical SAM protein [Phycisphaerae bacterium]|nr:PA0069 family radical SAM protein [Phycisphaerae bacterium]
MKRISNPPNPYVSQYHEWLEEPPAAAPEVYVERARSILSENDSPDLSFRWSCNPYRGCQHACAYCYARPTHEYLGFGAGTDFETRLIVKENAPELLRKAFSSRRWQRERVAFSGVTDCYQPLEAVWELTRRCLEVCRQFRNPACIVTKSYLIRRDVELLAAMAAEGHVHVCMSIAFADAKLCKLIEPQAPSPERRFEAMRILAEAGVPVGVMLAPVIPGLNDTEIPAVLDRAAECGATTAQFTPLRLPGSVEAVFLERLDEAMPLRSQRVRSRIRDIRGGELNDSRFNSRMTGQGQYWQAIEQLFEIACRKHGLNEPPCESDAVCRSAAGPCERPSRGAGILPASAGRDVHPAGRSTRGDGQMSLPFMLE